MVHAFLRAKNEKTPENFFGKKVDKALSMWYIVENRMQTCETGEYLKQKFSESFGAVERSSGV